MSGRVQTVLGPVDPGQLGRTMMHEHLLISQVRSGVAPPDPARWELPITLDRLDDVRRHPAPYPPNLVHDARAEALEEQRPFRAAGGGCIVDVTSRGIGRDPAGLRAIAEAAGVHVVMGCGYHTHPYHPPDLGARGEEEIAEEMARDLTEGVDGVAAGIIGEIGMSWPAHPDEVKVLRAATRAQRDTGAAVSVHPGRDARAPMEALRTVVEAGGDPERTIIDHLDGRFSRPEQFLEVAATGCYLEIDLFGFETSHFPGHPGMDMPNDGGRIGWLRLLLDKGYGSRLLISSDVAMKHHRRRYGGWGYAHILANVVPQMLARGLSRREVETILVDNPARALAR